MSPIVETSAETTRVPSRTNVRAREGASSSTGNWPEAPSTIRTLLPNEILFRTGDVKTCLYRVKSGAVALYEQPWDGDRTVIDFAFAGDLVGLGFLETHACEARAVAESELTLLPLEALAAAVEANPKAQAKLDDAIEREFEFRRASLVDNALHSPLTRVAAFLISASRINAHEGRDPRLVADSCSCGFVAEDLLGLSVESLSAVLAELEQRGLIEATPTAGLRLTDVTALEELAVQPDYRPARGVEARKGSIVEECSHVHAM
jgi:CRP/FNR family transcriptional regulator